MRHLVVDPTYGDRLFNRLDRCARQAEELVDDNGSICPESVMWFIMDLDDRLEEVEDKLEQIIHHLGLNNDN